MGNLIFSIIVPVYNAAGTLENCLDSICCQSFTDFEIILMDGASVDDSLQVAKKYADHYSNIRIITGKDHGIYDAMNKGIKAAKGEWLYFMGSDDILFDKNVLESLFKYINAGCDIIYGNSLWVPDNRKEVGEWDYLQLLNMSINHQRIFYRSTLFEKLGAFNESYKIASDYELNIRFFCDPGVKKKYINSTIARYHSGGYSANKIDGAFWDNGKNIFVKNFSPYLPQKVIYNRLSWYCWYNMQQKKYTKALHLFCSIYFYTFSFSFLKHSVSQLIKSGRNNNIKKGWST